MEKNICQLKDGEKGKIVSIEAGHGLTTRLESLGLREGRIVKKLGSHFMSGPQAVEVDRIKLAMGHGIARKIKVETLS